MSLLEWRDEFRIGIDEVDHEHRLLIDLINAAHGRGAATAALEAALGDIHAVVTAHFALEEKDMRAHGYPGLGAHKADHEHLLDDIRDIMDDVAAGAYPGDAEFAARLGDWFTRHFRTHDVELHRFLAGRERRP
jgi:hemerythrin